MMVPMTLEGLNNLKGYTISGLIDSGATNGFIHQRFVEENGLECGVGFPTGLSLNNCAAHYSPNGGDTTGEFVPQSQPMASENYTVLNQEDVLKVDFGVHVKGRIVDSAFTLTWDHTYDKLLEAVQAATNAGVRVSSRDKCSWSAGRSSFILGSRHRRTAL